MKQVYRNIFYTPSLSLLLTCTTLAAFGQESARELQSSANAKLQVGDTLGALKEMKQVAALNRTAGRPAELAHAEGFVKYLQHNYTGALTDFDRAIELNAHHAVAYYHRALAEGKLEMFQEQLQDYTTALQIDPYFADVYFSRGLAKAEAGKYAEAAQEFSSVLTIQANRIDALYQRAQAYGRMKDYKKQLADFDQLVRLKPYDIKPYIDRGLAKARQGHYEEALDDYDVALGLEPTNYEAKFHRQAAENKLTNRRSSTPALTSTHE